MNSHKLNPELAIVADFLEQVMPFSSLPENDFFSLIRHIEIQYHKQHTILTKEDARKKDGLRIIRSGAAEIRGDNEQLLDRIGEGESFNLSGLLEENSKIHSVFIEDTLVYFIAKNHYQEMRLKHRPFDRFFHGQRSRRISRALRTMTDTSALARPIRSLMTTEVFTANPEDSVQQLAIAMSEKRISSAIIIEQDSIVGIITDRDLRSRVLAHGLPTATKVSEVMTAYPISLPDSATVFDATLLMTRYGYHHIPVVKTDGKNNTKELLAGIITTSDLMLARQDDPVYLVQHVSRQKTVAGLAEVRENIPSLFLQWVNAQLPAAQISHVLTAISDAITTRLIELAIQRLGPAPVDFCWLAFGSQARGEQLLNADQDNGILMADSVTPTQLNWFKDLATFVCDGLNSCGYDYCPGKVMATTDEWRQPLQGWRQTVDRWTTSPTPDAVMRVSIFFDLRCVYGDTELSEQLQNHMLKHTQQNTIFQAALAANALENRPPLGIFRRFVVERNGD
ncbi:MAG: DUF294 nucleotidyltransferase-like domain-containing protein, partial [Pseudomonadales bacterium]|nr:DUF294 nucleotidyltransferase-like domain-containing protein [Pseudomonadales bacterium]